MLFSVLSPSTSNIACLANCLWQVGDRPSEGSQRVADSAYLSGIKHIEGCNQQIPSDCAGHTNYMQLLEKLNSAGGKPMAIAAN